MTLPAGPPSPPPGADTDPAAPPSPLLDLLVGEGGRAEIRLGRSLAVEFGSPAEELGRLRDECGLVDRPWLEIVRLRGEDRVRFLQGLVTCDVAAVGEGTVRPGFLTDVKGRVLADFELAARPGALDLRLAAGRSGPVAGHLGKYVLADRVEVRAVPEETVVSVVGPGAAGALAEVGMAVPADVRAIAEMGEVSIVRETDRGGVPVLTVAGPQEPVRGLARRLLEQGVRPAGFTAWEILRIESGVLRWGADLDEGTLPQETGRDEAISFEKGCYLGQEVVARIHYRGGVQKVPRGLRLVDGAESAAVAAGSEILFEGRPVGTLGSVASSPRHGRIGLSILHRRAAEPGTSVELEGGASARVMSLPFA